jgi:hypothetical protein
MGWRSRLLGVIRISGLRNGALTWRRSRWKYWAGVSVGHLHVVVGAKLKKALQPGAGMLRPQAFPAVGQQQGQPAQLLPLGLAAGDKQIDDALGVVDKIAELGLPQVRVWGRVTA